MNQLLGIEKRRQTVEAIVRNFGHAKVNFARAGGGERRALRRAVGTGGPRMSVRPAGLPSTPTEEQS